MARNQSRFLYKNVYLGEVLDKCLLNVMYCVMFHTVHCAGLSGVQVLKKNRELWLME